MVGCRVKKQSLPPHPSFCELVHQTHPNHNPFVHSSSKNLRPLPPFSPLPCASSSTPPPARNAFNHVVLPPSIGIGHCDGWLLHQQKISLSPPPMRNHPFPPCQEGIRSRWATPSASFPTLLPGRHYQSRPFCRQRHCHHQRTPTTN